MNALELQALVAEIRNGRPEGISLELKRQWPDLSRDEGKDELRKDVASIANSCENVGLLLFGLKDDGSIYNSPLPADEAAIQQILQGITPPLAVRLDVLEIEDGGHKLVLTAATVSAPFNRPYVARWRGANHVWIRNGSTIGTASRFELDRLYLERTPRPELAVSWEHWKTGIIVGNDEGALAEVLPIPQPRRSLCELEANLLESLQRHEDEAERTGYPTQEQLAGFRSSIPAFLASLSNQNNLTYWHHVKARDQDWVPTSVVFENRGKRPATVVKLEIDLPEWLIALDKPPGRPPNYVVEPRIPPPPQPASPGGAAGRRGTATYDYLRHSLPHFPQPTPIDGCWTSDGGASVGFWADRVRQDHTYRVGRAVRLSALPNAPQTASPLQIKGRIFFHEADGWRDLILQVRLVEPQPMASRPLGAGQEVLPQE